MPTYEYRCGACGTATEIFHSMTEAPKRKCPSCGKQRLERQISAGAGILFKGTGFYQTDYRSDAYKSAASADSSAAKPAEKSVETKPTASDGDAKSTASTKSETPAPKPEPAKKSSSRKKSD